MGERTARFDLSRTAQARGEGLLREVATEQVGARPARTTYEITDKGAAEFQSLLRNNWWNLTTPPDPFMAAFSFLPALPRVEAAAALRNRATQLQASIEQLRAAQNVDWLDNKPIFVSWMWELTIDRSQAEIGWCTRTAERIEADRAVPPGRVPRQAARRRRTAGWTCRSTSIVNQV